MNKQETIKEIQKFLLGKNETLKYLVNVETDPNTNRATCIVHEPNCQPRIEMHQYTPFIYIKDFKKEGYSFYNGDKRLLTDKMKGYNIKTTKLKTGNHPRLKNGFLYKVSCETSYNNILEFFKDGGIYPYDKIRGNNGNVIKDKEGRPTYKYRKLFFQPRLEEQFLISTGSRLYKGIEEYNQIHKLIFDIETTGLRFERSRIFAIGLKDNNGYEKILEVEKSDDDEAEKKLIIDFFVEAFKIKPAIIAGYNSEEFDFKFIMGRAKILGIDLKSISTTLDSRRNIRRYNATIKIGNKAERYERTNMWGYSVIDINHASKKTAAINSDIKNTKLKYICKFEDIAKANRMYINGEGGKIGKFWHQNNIFIINPKNNNYLEIPKEFETTAKRLYLLQSKKSKLSDKERTHYKKVFLMEEPKFVLWLRENGKKYGKYEFIEGKNILKQYLLDDLWETEQVDNLYNQSSFLLAKIVPTTYARICTMGTASIWNLLLTTWSYENSLAIPIPDKKQSFSGGLARCYKKGYIKNINKIDYSGLYPMIQLEYNVFPLFDFQNVMKKILMYTTTTRNIYKKLANSNKLNKEEQDLLLNTGHDDIYNKIYSGEEFTKKERNLFKVKQLPIKILNNSLFGALGSGYAFNWSDNICAARITCTGRLYLRHVISWFKSRGCEPLLAVTDGVNFQIPDDINIAELINEFNSDEIKSEFMFVDDEGKFKSCLNLSRINYSVLFDKKDKKTGKIIETVKNTGNTIKSKTMPEYIEDFIDKGMVLILNGKGDEFVDYYISYAEDLFYRQVPLKKIASKSKIKNTINEYLNRGKDKNNRQKARQAHMELLIKERDDTTNVLFEKYFEDVKQDDDRTMKEYGSKERAKLMKDYMPFEHDLDTMVYYVNTGTRKSHGDVKTIKNDDGTETVEIKAIMIKQTNLEENPELKGEYNIDKYLEAFNTRVEVLLEGFEPEIREDILVKVKNLSAKSTIDKKTEKKELIINHFTKEDLALKAFNHDDYELSMCLEAKEVVFWNESGYNPYDVWDGFKIYVGGDYDKYSNVPLEYEIYDFKLKYISNEMKKVGKPEVKSVNETLFKGDYILTKDCDTYNLGYHNGEFVEILRENIDMPKSSIELKREQEEIIRQKKIESLKIEDAAIIIDTKLENEIQLFKNFKKEWDIPSEMTKKELFELQPRAKDAFEDYIYEHQSDQNEEDIQFETFTVDY